MAKTITIGSDWFVIEDICGIVSGQPDATPPVSPRMLMRGGHILTMEGLSQAMVDSLRALREGAGVPGAFGEQVAGSQPTPDMQARVNEFIPSYAKTTDIDMSPETVIDVPAAEKPA